MRLADFIEANTQTILDDAVQFAVSQAPGGARLNIQRLRNDIPHILQEIVADLRTPHSAAYQRAKSLGRAPASPGPASRPPSPQCSTTATNSAVATS